MSIDTRLKVLERAAAAGTGESPRVVSEAEFEELPDADKIRYLRGHLDLRLISEDNGPTLDEACAAAGVAPFGARPGESDSGASRLSDAQLAVYADWMAAGTARYMARRAARLAAKAGKAVPGLTVGY